MKGVRILSVVAPALLSVSAFAATRYDGDGVVSARVERIRWLVNRARFAPEREADRLGLVNTNRYGHPDYDTCEDTNGVNNFGVDTNVWAAWRASKGPLAPNVKLGTAARKHSTDMGEALVLSHFSPSARYYPVNSAPWQRHQIETYTNDITGYYENIAYGYRYSTGGYPAQALETGALHEGFFVDAAEPTRGHRMAILNSDAREVGLGSYRTNYTQWSGGYLYYWVWDWETIDLGKSGTRHFFSDTVFHDANTNGVYDEGEGAAGVEVRLWNGASEAAGYDVSTPSGNFAVPLDDVPDGASVTVQFVNTGSAPVRVTVPLDYDTLGTLTLTGGERRVYGSFVCPAGAYNVGFRQVDPVATVLGVTVTGTTCTIRAQTLERVDYSIQACDLPGSTNWSTFSTLTATNGVTVFTDSTSSGLRFYRVFIQKD